MAFPRTILGHTRPAAKRKSAFGAMTSSQLRWRSDLVSSKASYTGLIKGLTPLCLKGSASSHIPGTQLALGDRDCQGYELFYPLAGVEHALDSGSAFGRKPPKGTVIPCMTVVKRTKMAS
jgi:hypothetical protein